MAGLSKRPEPLIISIPKSSKTRAVSKYDILPLPMPQTHGNNKKSCKIMHNRRFSKRADGLLGMVVTQVLCHSFIEIWCLKSWQNTKAEGEERSHLYRVENLTGDPCVSTGLGRLQWESLWNRWESLCIILGYFRHLYNHMKHWSVYTLHVITYSEMIYLNVHTTFCTATTHLLQWQILQSQVAGFSNEDWASCVATNIA